MAFVSLDDFVFLFAIDTSSFFSFYFFDIRVLGVLST